MSGKLMLNGIVPSLQMDTARRVRTILGSMDFGRHTDLHQSTEIVQMCLDLGCLEFDTAHSLNGGVSEQFVGQMDILKDPNVIVATKVHPRKSLKYDSVLEQCKISLDRLKRERVDIFYLHAPDHETPIEETLKAVDHLYKADKFTEFGLSNFAAWQVAEVYYLCRMNGYVLPTVYQGMYNPVTREIEKELFPCIRKLGMRFYAYNALAGGLLTGKHSYEDKENQPYGRFFGTKFAENYRKRYWKKSLFDSVTKVQVALKQVYDGHVSMGEASVRWMYHHSQLNGQHGDAVVMGASSKNHLEENLRSSQGGPLHEDVVKAFDEAWHDSRADCPQYFR